MILMTFLVKKSERADEILRQKNMSNTRTKKLCIAEVLNDLQLTKQLRIRTVFFFFKYQFKRMKLIVFISSQTIASITQIRSYAKEKTDDFC